MIAEQTQEFSNEEQLFRIEKLSIQQTLNTLLKDAPKSLRLMIATLASSNPSKPHTSTLITFKCKN